MGVEFDPFINSLDQTSPSTDARLASLERYSAPNSASSTAITGTTSETSFSQVVVLPAGYLKAGRAYRYEIWGAYSTTVLGGTFTLRIKDGSTVLFDLPAVALGSLVQTNQGFHFEGVLTVRTAGASGAVATNGQLTVDSGGQKQVANVANKSIDTTTQRTMTATATLSHTTASITLEQFIVSELSD